MYLECLVQQYLIRHDDVTSFTLLRIQNYKVKPEVLHMLTH